ncbi:MULTISPECIES: hypothetical protein [Pseudomonas]|uniref:hypothetical protein n=1 Tax=Pseudomonas TaxID=286 RepID=UPI0006CCD7BC|nr:hypothetical protein [Pseudomonas fuscovaginae]KPA99419.1 hypothetical protein PF70_00394 [Pseudomonas fuscovaginae]
MRELLSFACVGAVLLMSAGCTTPPMAPPDALTDYRPVSQFGSEPVPENLKNRVEQVCKLVGVVPSPDDATKFVVRALQKTYVRSCQYAFYSDKVKDFKAYSDEATLGFASITAIGALTDSHSDFVKSMAGLTGLTAGLRVYANPNVQISTYIKAANATQCLGGSLQRLNKLTVQNEILLGDLASTEKAIEDVRGGLNKIKYNPEMQSALISTAPGPEVLSLLNQASDPDADAESKKAALEFLKNIETLTDENLRSIYGKILATLNSQAFNVDSATQPIKASHVGRGGGSGDKDKIIFSIKSSEKYQSLVSDDASGSYDMYIGLLGSLYVAKAEDDKIPYAELIRINDDFDRCMTTYAAN